MGKRTGKLHRPITHFISSCTVYRSEADGAIQRQCRTWCVPLNNTAQPYAKASPAIQSIQIECWARIECEMKKKNTLHDTLECWLLLVHEFNISSHRPNTSLFWCVNFTFGMLCCFLWLDRGRSRSHWLGWIHIPISTNEMNNHLYLHMVSFFHTTALNGLGRELDSRNGLMRKLIEVMGRNVPSWNLDPRKPNCEWNSATFRWRHRTKDPTNWTLEWQELHRKMDKQHRADGKAINCDSINDHIEFVLLCPKHISSSMPWSMHFVIGMLLQECSILCDLDGNEEKYGWWRTEKKTKFKYPYFYDWSMLPSVPRIAECKLKRNFYYISSPVVFGRSTCLDVSCLFSA